MPLRRVTLLLLASALSFASASGFAARGDAPTSATLTQDQIRALIRLTADKDLENDKKQRDYTYIEREETRTLKGNGQVKSTRSRPRMSWRFTASRWRS